MRAVGFILVLLGALVLGSGWFDRAPRGANPPAPNAGQQSDPTANEEAVWVPPVLGGIAVVSGLVLLASTGRRD
jgi:hypothetical protein